MTDKNGMIDRIEDGLGSEGSREIAERMFDILRADGRVVFDADYGFSMQDLDESEWLHVVEQATA